MTTPSLWFATSGGRYTGPEPSWFDPSEFDWVPALEANWTTIRDEVLALARNAEPDPYFVHALVFPPRAWRAKALMFWGWPMPAHIAACPRTMQLLDQIPGLVGASLSVLEGGANINPHQGDTNATIRVHLPLSVPAGLPDCGFQVGSEARPWIEGRAMLFLDARTHFAWNQTDTRRDVLIVDILRPGFAARRDHICATVLASLLMHGLAQRAPWIDRLPIVGRALHLLARCALRLALPIRRRLGWQPPRPVPPGSDRAGRAPSRQ